MSRCIVLIATSEIDPALTLVAPEVDGYGTEVGANHTSTTTSVPRTATMGVVDGIVSVVILVVVAVVLGLVGWQVYRVVRASQFEKLGWRYSRDPGEASVFGLNRPPFGLGRERRVRELVEGEVGGVPFRAMAYQSSAGRVPGFVVTVPLTRSLPPLVVGGPHALPEAALGESVPAPDGLAARADDPAWAEAALREAGSALAGWAGASISVDGRALVGLGCDDRPEAVTAFVGRLGRVAAALEGPALAGFTGPAVPPEMALVHHPDWVYRSRDASMLDHVRAQRGGHDHEAVDVMFLSSDEVGFIALTHRWKTRRTVTESGPNGTTTTRTVEDNHSEDIFEITLGFPFPTLSVNKAFDWGRGERVHFESDDFNRDFAVRCADPRFASHVFHPRQMQYLQQARPPGFVLEDGRIRIDWDARVATIDWWLDFTRGFFGRVPGFVWKDLGVEPPRLMVRWLA